MKVTVCIFVNFPIAKCSVNLTIEAGKCHFRYIKTSRSLPKTLFSLLSSAIMFFFFRERTFDNSKCYNYAEHLTFLCVTFNFLFLRVFCLHYAKWFERGGDGEGCLLMNSVLVPISPKTREI